MGWVIDPSPAAGGPGLILLGSHCRVQGGQGSQAIPEELWGHGGSWGCPQGASGLGGGVQMPLRMSGPGAKPGVTEGLGLCGKWELWVASGQVCSSQPGRISRGQAPWCSAQGSGWPELAVGRWGVPILGQGTASLARAHPTTPTREWQSMVTATRVRHSPVITRQVHGNETGPRSSWEVKSAGQGQGPAPDQQPMAQCKLSCQAAGAVAPARAKLWSLSLKADPTGQRETPAMGSL